MKYAVAAVTCLAFSFLHGVGMGLLGVEFQDAPMLYAPPCATAAPSSRAWPCGGAWLWGVERVFG